MFTLERLPLHSPGYRQCLSRWSELDVQLDDLQARLRAAGVEPTRYSMTDNEQVAVLLTLAAVALAATFYFSWV